MQRHFTDANELLDHLLDRHEAGVVRPLAYPDYEGFTLVTAADAFLKALRQVEEIGAVRLAYGKNSHRERVDRVHLESADVLYRYRGRTPIASVAREAHEKVIGGLSLHPVLVATASEMASAWASVKSWNGFGPEDADKVRDVFLLVQAILDGRHAGMDYRTFSRRVSGDSKTLERLERQVVRLLTNFRDLPPDARPREALRALGLEKFAPPLLISGHFDLADPDLSRGMPLYLGIPPNEADRLRFHKAPAYLLTIENYASFNRHIIEADPTRVGVTIYVGGYPSLAMQSALGILASKLPESVPLFHWSDIDADGTWIFRTIEKAIGRTLRPHLMSAAIAEQFGRPRNGSSNIRDCPPDSGIAALVEYLARDDGKTVEQEELDPKLPVELVETSAVAT
jgi:hypothetical protein